MMDRAGLTVGRRTVPVMSREFDSESLPAPTAQQRPLVASGLSLACHLVAFIAGALLIRVSAPISLEESDRPVNIVLAANSSQSSAVQYFNEATASEASSESSAIAASSASSASGLPESSRPPSPTNDIALPGALAPITDGVNLPTASTSGASSGTAVIDPTVGMDEILAAEAKRPRSRGPDGPQGEVSIFGGGTTRGHSFVFLIDRSESMGSGGLGAIAAAQVELLAALKKLRSNHQFQIVAYNQLPAYFKERKLISVSDESIHAGEEYLENLPTFGATDHVRAIMSVLQLRPDVIYLLTDGDPVISASQRKRIREESKGRTTISCIQFGRIRPEEEATQSALNALAAENRGSYTFVDMAKR